MKRIKNEMPKQYYEIILYRSGSVVERIKTPNMATFKGEYERIERIAAINTAYSFEANLYDSDNNFEKRIK